MINKKNSIFITLMFSSLIQSKPNAFCSVPVADLIGSPLAKLSQKSSPIKQYTDMPYCDTGYLSPRMCQLLFNEQVEVLETYKDEVKVKISHFYYKTTQSDKKNQTYWTQKKNITFLTELQSSDYNKIPITPSFDTKKLYSKNSITLLAPYQDHKSHIYYSAGTTFTKSKIQKKGSTITVNCFNPSTKMFSLLTLPKKICSLNKDRSPQEKRSLFLSILQLWAHQKDGFIPYVFGGASIVDTFNAESFTVKKFTYENKPKTFFYRKKKKPLLPCAGIDCSQLIARAAHIAGIPYFVKNTTTISKDLEPLTKNDIIQNGDILVWRGHTAVISDVKKGLLIEARGYDHGYGIVHEIPFSEQFKDIHTTEQLKNAYFTKKQIPRLNKEGKKVSTIYDLQIMKLPVF